MLMPFKVTAIQNNLIWIRISKYSCQVKIPDVERPQVIKPRSNYQTVKQPDDYYTQLRL